MGSWSSLSSCPSQLDTDSESDSCADGSAAEAAVGLLDTEYSTDTKEAAKAAAKLNGDGEKVFTPTGIAPPTATR